MTLRIRSRQIQLDHWITGPKMSWWAIITIVSSLLSPSIASITACSVAVSSALVVRQTQAAGIVCKAPGNTDALALPAAEANPPLVTKVL